MKGYLLFFITIAALDIMAQNGVVQGYAYQRATLPGVQISVVEEGGGIRQAPMKPKMTYFIYLESKPDANIRPAIAWINGRPYEIRAEKIDSGPILLPRSGVRNELDTLVGKTNNTIWQLHPGKEADVKPSGAVAKRMKKSQVVIEYYRGNKKRCFDIDRMKSLTPLAMQ